MLCAIIPTYNLKPFFIPCILQDIICEILDKFYVR